MTHIVFVDDDPAVLDGFRRGLRASRGTRRMSFVPSGAAALDALDAGPVDVMVTDMLMPGMDGADLLHEVRTRSPQTVRIVLSGYASSSASLRSSTVAHMFLSKPCAMTALSSALDTACSLADRLSRPELRRLLGGLETLPSAPRSFTAINAALSEPSASSSSVAEVIEQDAGASAKLLQLVNSAFFGLARKATTVQDAVTYLGLTSVRGIVLASEVAGSLDPLAPDLALAVEAINDHSLAVAELAQTLVPRAQRLDAFVAGMLHDVGRLALAAAAPDLFRQVRDEQLARAQPIDVVERELLDATHADLGAYLLQLWGLPLALIDPVARHHDADALTCPDALVRAVATADQALAATGHETTDAGTAASPVRREELRHA